MVLSQLDRTLLERCLTRSEGAWEEFVDRFLPLMVYVVTQTGRQRFADLPDDWRDDLVAEVLLALIDDDFAILRRFQGNSSLGTYLVVVARRLVVKKLAKLRRVSGESSVGTNHLASEGGEFDRIDQQEQVEALLKRLPQQEAQAIRLFHFEHRTYAEIGSHLGLPENSVGPLLSRARRLMKAMEAQDKTA